MPIAAYSVWEPLEAARKTIDMTLSLFRWFKDVSIAKKLYFTVGIMALLIIVELGALYFSINILSSVRAYVGGEGLWSKAQKDALYQLQKYARTHDEADYHQFREFTRVNLGDHKFRMELSKPNPDLAVARQGFIEGRNHPDDIDGMITLFRWFNSNRYIARAIVAWTKADVVLSEFYVIGDKLHAEINQHPPSQERINALLSEIDPLNARLTPLEDEFSYALGEGSRWLENLVLRILFIIALTVECTGLGLAIFVSRNIQKGLNEILLSSKAVAKGDYTRRATAFSRDEIGILANNFNEMAGNLEWLRKENARANASLEKANKSLEEANSSLEKKVKVRTTELEIKNKELEQFAYVASHDLQEPLRTISGIVDLLQKQYTGQLEGNGDKYLDYLSQSSDRMKILIKDLLDYSRIGKEKESMEIDCNALLEEVVADLGNIIKQNEAVIRGKGLPVIHAYPTELKLLFQNLIANAIKFRKPGIPPSISINASRENGLWKFSVSDNGIGIESQFLERIFIIFQRLHNRTEYEGSGIGLAHCKKIVEMHGGKIWAESEPGEGSRFFFTLSEQ